MKTFIHETAVIDDGATLGHGVKVWHFSHICSGAKISDSVSIGQNVFVANKVLIGRGCKIQNNVCIYDDVTLEDDVFCGPSMVFTNVINPRAFIERKDEFLPTKVCKGVTLGANCTIVCGITIGEYAFVAAGAVIRENVKAFALMAGVPARQIGWMSRVGEKIPLPITGNGTFRCKNSGDCYKLLKDKLILENK